MRIRKTGRWFKVRRKNKAYLPLEITETLNVKENEAIEICKGPNNEIVLQKYEGEI